MPSSPPVPARIWEMKVKPELAFAETPVDLKKLPYFRRECFPDAGPLNWLDRPDAAEVIPAKKLSPEITQLCLDWSKDGFVQLPGLISPQRLDKIWASFERAASAKVIAPEPKSSSGVEHRFLNPHFIVPALWGLAASPEIRRYLQIFMGREVTPIQTIVLPAGTEQKIHSDAIHMTTYPLGYLTAAWVAFEDIHEDSGPLTYYPGSHRLPYYLSQETGIGPGEFARRGDRVYHEIYEPFIEQLVKREKLKPQKLLAKKGDVFLWHHNLLHGGTLRNDRTLSRKSVVCHYFAKGAIGYHDLSGVLATQ